MAAGTKEATEQEVAEEARMRIREKGEDAIWREMPRWRRQWRMRRGQRGDTGGDL